MKKTWLFLMTVTLALCLCACGKGAFGRQELSVTVNGTAITADSPVQSILSVLGEDYTYTEAVSCVYDGMDGTYSYENAQLYTFPDGDAQKLMELYLTGGDAVTGRGIGLGASRAEVEEAYGKGELTGIVLTYALEASSDDMVPASLSFELDGDTVCAISLTAEHRAE